MDLTSRVVDGIVLHQWPLALVLVAAIICASVTACSFMQAIVYVKYYEHKDEAKS